MQHGRSAGAGLDLRTFLQTLSSTTVTKNTLKIMRTGRGTGAFLCIAMIALWVSMASAVETPKWIQLEKIQLSTGVKAGTWTLRFNLYDDQFFGNNLWVEDVQVKVVKVSIAGRSVPQITNVVLGKVNPLQGIDFGQQVFLGVSTTGNTPVCPNFPIDSQHVKAGVMPNALWSDYAGNAQYSDTANLATHAASADAATHSTTADTATTCVNWASVACPDGQCLKGFTAGGIPTCVPCGVAAQQAPTVTTGSATAISQTGASLSGAVNPNGAATNGWFEYGLTTSYGTATSPQQSMGSGSGAVALGPKAITGLTCGTPYHYRAVASNSGGTTNGSDQQFTTSSCPSGTSIPFDATNWEGETWYQNGYEGAWFPPVAAGVADFAGADCRIEMLRTKTAAISKGQTVSIDIYPLLNTSGTCYSQALIGFGNYPVYNADPMTAIVFLGAGHGSDDGKVFFATRSGEGWATGNQIGTYSKNTWVHVTLQITAGNVFSVNVGGQTATMTSPVTSAQFQLAVTNHDSAAGFTAKQVVYQ